MIHYHTPNQDGKNYESNDAGFAAVDYDLPLDELNISEIHLSKRYPNEGFALNNKSKMVVKIMEGGVTFTCEEESVFLPKGSIVLVDTNKKYSWEPKPEVTLYIVSIPPWTPEQAEVIVG